MKRTLFAVFMVGIVMSASAFAASWTLTTADFQSQSVTLNSIDASGVHINFGTQESVVSYSKFLDLTRQLPPAPVSGKFLLFVVGGDSISGEPMGIKGNSLVWLNSTLGEVAIPMKQLVSMTKPGGQPADARKAEDVVVLSNGDTLHGIITSIGDGKVTVQADAGNTAVPVSAISQIN